MLQRLISPTHSNHKSRIACYFIIPFHIYLWTQIDTQYKQEEYSFNNYYNTSTNDFSFTLIRENIQLQKIHAPK